VVDALGYGTFLPAEFNVGEGAPAVDPPAGQSVARRFANVDTNDNATDFLASAPTPGSAAFAVPEPASAGLLAVGLLGLARFGRRRGSPAGLAAAPRRGRLMRRRRPSDAATFSRLRRAVENGNCVPHTRRPPRESGDASGLQHERPTPRCAVPR